MAPLSPRARARPRPRPRPPRYLPARYWPGRRPRLVRSLLITMLALVTVASAMALARGWHTPGEHTAGGLTTHLQRAEWTNLGHVHDGDGGFVMPDEMMPGAPRGDEVRLGISLTLTNATARTQQFHAAEEFSLVGGGLTQPRRLSADTISPLSRLGPQAAVDGVLYFDVEVPGADDPPLRLQWQRAGQVILFPLPADLPADTDAPVHEHG